MYVYDVIMIWCVENYEKMSFVPFPCPYYFNSFYLVCKCDCVYAVFILFACLLLSLLIIMLELSLSQRQCNILPMRATAKVTHVHQFFFFWDSFSVVAWKFNVTDRLITRIHKISRKTGMMNVRWRILVWYKNSIHLIGTAVPSNGRGTFIYIFMYILYSCFSYNTDQD